MPPLQEEHGAADELQPPQPADGRQQEREREQHAEHADADHQHARVELREPLDHAATIGSKENACVTGQDYRVCGRSPEVKASTTTS